MPWRITNTFYLITRIHYDVKVSFQDGDTIMDLYHFFSSKRKKKKKVLLPKETPNEHTFDFDIFLLCPTLSSYFILAETRDIISQLFYQNHSNIKLKDIQNFCFTFHFKFFIINHKKRSSRNFHVQGKLIFNAFPLN